jgi:hypothetical protein
LRTQAAKLNFVPAFTRKQRLLLAIIPPLAALLIRALGATLRYRDITAPGAPIGIKIPGPTIFAFWHRTLLIAAHRFRNHNIAILISASFDGELIARTVALLGFHPVRGSSSRGGAPGLRAMAQAYTEGHICAFTADGPRGPNMIAKPGPVQLADLTSAPWVGAFHGNPSRAWQLNSWDRFLIPKPFSTVTFAWPAHVAPDLTAVQRALDEAVRMSTPNS